MPAKIFRDLTKGEVTLVLVGRHREAKHPITLASVLQAKKLFTRSVNSASWETVTEDLPHLTSKFWFL